MTKKTDSIILFNEKQVRRHRDEDKELWYFSIIDVITLLTNSNIPKRYWSDLKNKLKNEGNETYEKIVHLKMTAQDGKQRGTDCFSTEDLFRVIQSISSPKAEPFKLWLAKIGYERIEETEDPELAIDRAMETYLKKGYSKDRINQRIKTIEVRQELTDERKERDNMNNLELVLNMLAEASTTEISKKKKPKGLEANKDIARKGGNVAKQAKLAIEKQTDEDISTSQNAKDFQSNKLN